MTPLPRCWQPCQFVWPDEGTSVLLLRRPLRRRPEVRDDQVARPAENGLLDSADVGPRRADKLHHVSARRNEQLITSLAVTVRNKNVLIYQLVFYSKSELGEKLWKETQRGVGPQLSLLDEDS